MKRVSITLMALRTLYQTLLDSDQARLRVIARQWDIELSTTRKTDMAAELMAAMASGDAVAQMLDQLKPDQRAALDDLLRHGGALPWAVFVRRAGEVRAIGPGRVEREELWRTPVSAGEALWNLGLVQRAFDDNEGHAVEMAFVPEDLMLYMPEPAPLEIPNPPVGTHPAHISPGDDTLADDLVNVWATLQRDRSADDVTPEALTPPELERRQLLEALSTERGWLKEGLDNRLHPSANEVLSWLKADPWTQWAALANVWVAGRTWNDLAHVATLRPDPVHGWPNDPLGTRQAFLKILTTCRSDTWYDLESFRAYVKAHATDFLRPDGNYNTWAPRDARTEAPLRGFDAWDMIEGALIDYLITCPLHWLGLVDLGSAAPAEPPTAFRLTDAGSAILHKTEAPSFAEPPAIRLLNGVELSVPRHCRYERFQLSRIADATGPPENDAFHYRLSPASLGRAKRQRIPLARIISFLQEATGGGALPANLQTALQRAYQGTGQAGLAHLWVLRVCDPQFLEIPAIAALIIRRIAPGIAAIREQDRTRACQILLQNGLLVDLDET
ncbi:MAG: hypothetical protein J7M39_05955 [Anaerolineae bacterium]|nr:hypothetical protein [Anaerolineae bacterium]